MKKLSTLMFLLSLITISRSVWGHGFPLYISPDETTIGTSAEEPLQGNDQVFSAAFSYSNLSDHTSPLDTDHGNPFVGSDPVGDGVPGYNVFPAGTSFTYNLASALYFSNGGTAVPAYVDPTNPAHVSNLPDASVALVFANVNYANPPLYSLYGNQLPASFSIQANQDGHELDKELFHWASSQGNGVYGFAFTVTATLPDSTIVTSAPLVDVFASPDFASSGSLDAATGAIVTEVTTSTWTGAGGNANWSTSQNWSRAPLKGMNLVFSGAVQTQTTNDSLSSARTITFDNTAAPFTLSGIALTLSGGVTNNSPNTQTVNLNLKLSAAQQINAASGNLVINGAIDTGGNVVTATGSTNTTLAGSISGSGGISMAGSGTLALAGNNSYTGGTTVSSGTLLVKHVNGLGSTTVGPGLAISNGATTNLQAGLNGPVQLPGLSIDGGSISPTSTLDITNNNIVVHNGDISTTVKQARSGLNSSGALWAGPGLTSSTAAADAAAHGNSTTFAVGAIQNIDKNASAIYSTWPASPSPASGISGLATTDVLMKYTYFGDADLNGVVDNTTDYDLWSNGFTNPGLAATNPWLYGDFDYSGVVDNTTDYDLWSTGFAHQGGPLSGNSPTGSGAPSVQPVPEPAGIVLVPTGLLAATCVRRCLRSLSHARAHHVGRGGHELP
jgi:autotransporter-associated beta strand protein